jgi:chemotaxis protein CheY-P-specific phosphatase CheC
MPLPILICDDSALARKQIARSLPKDWDISISFAENGQLGLESIKRGEGDIVFLDLNMPVMDGYQVLKEVQKQDLPTIVIVISGDIQPEAHARVRELGALDFIEKPINNEKLTEILEQYGIYKQGSHHSLSNPESTSNNEIEDAGIRDVLQEIANIAMGRAGDLLSRLLNEFILLPIPNVSTVECSQLNQMLIRISKNDTVSIVNQGFISSGISGEAIMIFHDSSFNDMNKLLKYENMTGNNLEIEMMNDISNILIGAFLNGLAEQLDIHFSQGQPTVLGQHGKIEDMVKNCKKVRHRMLSIEIHYSIQHHDIKCDLLLLFTEDSIRVIKHKIGYLLE